MTGGAVALTYQKIPCLWGEYTNPQGAASGSGYVVMTQENFDRHIDARDAWKPIGGPGGTTERNPDTGGPVPPLGAGLTIRGDLEFVHANGGTKRLIDLYLADDGVEDERRSVEAKVDRGLVRIPLRDIRWLWSRGDFYGRYNVPSRAIVAGDAGTGEREEVVGEALEPESTRPDGQAYTLADLVRLCLRRLPGGLVLAGPAAEIAEATKIIPRNLIYHGEPAADVMTRLLSRYNFRFALDLESNKAQIWRFNHGRPTAVDEGGVLQSLSFVTLDGDRVVDPLTVLGRKRDTRYFYRPPAVRVVGRPVIREVKLTGLEAVGEDPNGEVVPLDDALTFIAPAQRGTEVKAGERKAMTRAELASWVLLHPDEQVAWRDHALTATQIEALRTWGFKWFRLPDKARAAFCPILPQRARPGRDGLRMEPAVFADSFDEVPFDVWGQRVKLAIAALDERSAAAAQNAPGVADEIRAIEEALADADDFSTKTRVKIAEEVRERLLEDSRLIEARIAIERREIAETEGNEIRFWNHYSHKVNAARYQVDPSGVVRFDRVIGAVQIAQGRAAGAPVENRTPFPTDVPTAPPPFTGARPAAGPAVAVYVSEGATLDPFPRVSIIFAYESSARARKALAAFGPTFTADPSGDKGGDYVDQYTFLGSLEKGKVKHLNPDGIEPANARLLFPRLVKLDAKCFYDVNLRTNRADIDKAAEDLVRRELEGEDQAPGETGEAATFYALHPTGAVTSVSWAAVRTDRGPVARTRWTVGLENRTPKPGAGWTGDRAGSDPGGVTASNEGPRR